MRNKHVSLHLTHDEFVTLNRAARADGVTQTTAWARDVLLEAARLATVPVPTPTVEDEVAYASGQ